MAKLALLSSRGNQFTIGVKKGGEEGKGGSYRCFVLPAIQPPADWCDQRDSAMLSYCSPVPGRQRLQCAGIVIRTQQRRCCCRRRCRCYRQRQCCQLPAPVGNTAAAAAAEQRKSANARDNSFLSFSFKSLLLLVGEIGNSCWEL